MQMKIARLLEMLEALPRTAPLNMAGEYAKGEVFLLNFICSCGGPARPGDMSKALGTSTARISAALNNMERKGWVYRETDPSDKRKTLVYITLKGKAFVSSYREQLYGKVKTVFDELGEHDTEEFIRISEKIAEISAKRMRQNGVDETGMIAGI